MKNLLLLVCLLSITITSCKKEEANVKDPSDYTREDFIGSYSFEYIHQIILSSQSGQQISDETTKGTRTIYIGTPNGNYGCSSNGNSIVIRNLKGNGNTVCAIITDNTYIIDEAIYAEGEGTLTDNKLTINMDSPFAGKPKDNIRGSAIKE